MVKETADQTFEVLMSDLDPEAMKVFYSGWLFKLLKL